MRLAFTALALVTAATPLTAGPFTGRWVADLDTQAGLGKDIYLVANDVYSCASCHPQRRYPADGKLRPVPGDPDVQAESVTIAGPRTIVTHIVEPAMTRTTTMTVSADNRTATYVSIDHRPGIRQALRTVYVARRTADAPPGAHPVSGTWQGVAYREVPELIRTTLLTDGGGSFSYRVPVGVTYTARFGEAPVAVHGPGTEGMQAVVRRDGPRQIVETRTRGGKVVLIRTFSLATDGRRLEILSRYPDSGSSFAITARRR